MPKISEKKKIFPTVKQDRLADEIIKNEKRKNPDGKVKMLENVGYTPTTAKTKSAEIFSSRGLKQALINRGLSEDMIIHKVQEGLNANVVTVHRGKARESNVPDYKIRNSYLNTFADIMGLKKIQVEQKNINVNANIEDLISDV